MKHILSSVKINRGNEPSLRSGDSQKYSFHNKVIPNYEKRASKKRTFDKTRVEK